MLKVKVISLPYIFQVLYVLCFTRPRYQVSVYRTIGPLVFLFVVTAARVVPCGIPIKRPRTSSIVQFKITFGPLRSAEIF